MDKVYQSKEKKIWQTPEIISLNILGTESGNPGSTNENTAFTHS